ncbi:hypothetical protein KM043_011631 [Ampulex compressa]|nr:hypothetical protein KM043_011631 [Ampulex compressa]
MTRLAITVIAICDNCDVERKRHAREIWVERDRRGEWSVWRAKKETGGSWKWDERQKGRKRKGMRYVAGGGGTRGSSQRVRAQFTGRGKKEGIEFLIKSPAQGSVARRGFRKMFTQASLAIKREIQPPPSRAISENRGSASKGENRWFHEAQYSGVTSKMQLPENSWVARRNRISSAHRNRCVSPVIPPGRIETAKVGPDSGRFQERL